MLPFFQKTQANKHLILYNCERFILRKGKILRLSENIRVNSNITEGGVYHKKIGCYVATCCLQI